MNEMRTIQPLLILMAVALVIGACSDESALVGTGDGFTESEFAERKASPEAYSAPAPETSTAKFEISWMQGMIDHHTMAAMMSEVCLEKAIHEELRQLCEQIIATQMAEIELMQAWLQDWYGIVYEPEMNPGMINRTERLEALEPAEFEETFMEMMIRHHRQAIKDSEKALRKAYHPELLALAQEIIETQRQEIQTMQTWLCDWYDVCRAAQTT